MTREEQMVITMLELAKSKEKQFESDLRRLKEEKPVNQGMVKVKEGHLADVRRQIQDLMRKMK